ncbi:hypothetical protein AVEN_80928-1 [Araneus ventricosus]|uniref:Thyroglobulin type-1 domain-containing protein n=1 Tax=Araneus ventricosus TaxID=182803 RepID=A0A4Y2GNA0_ARAVE|nr:hypothetical protein AVEN_80928-1 [Araneus ventricosus]
MLKILTYVVLICLSPRVLCFYRYPGYPGFDCPTAREGMMKRPSSYWMIPKCNDDGTFQEKQCYDAGGPDDCMCVYKDGTLLSLANQGFNTTTCLCHAIAYERSLIGKHSFFAGFEAMPELASAMPSPTNEV